MALFKPVSLKLFQQHKKKISTKSDALQHPFDAQHLFELIKFYEKKSSKSDRLSRCKKFMFCTTDVDSSVDYLDNRSFATPIGKDLRFSPSHDTPTKPVIDEFPFDVALYDHGYTTTKLIRETSQGQILEVCCLKNRHQKFVIKKVEKNLYRNKVTKKGEDGIRMMVEKDVVKEALLMYHCTVANQPPVPCLPQFIDFFQDELYYYLVMDHSGIITMEQWCQTAFEYIKNETLDLHHYQAVVKFIFWQLSVLMHWLHHDMNIAHLGIKMDHIMIEKGDFMTTPDGNTRINPQISIKLCDFSLSEIFGSVCAGYCGQNALRTFDSKKHCFGDYLTYCAPQIFAVERYNAQKADIWSMAVVLYRLTVGQYPYTYQNVDIDARFNAICRNELGESLEQNGLSEYCCESTLALIGSMLNYRESKRPNALQILQSEWLDVYWQKYKEMITKTSICQRERLNKHFHKKWMQSFPYHRN
eukprot:13589_1